MKTKVTSLHSCRFNWLALFCVCLNLSVSQLIEELTGSDSDRHVSEKWALMHWEVSEQKSKDLREIILLVCMCEYFWFPIPLIVSLYPSISFSLNQLINHFLSQSLSLSLQASIFFPFLHLQNQVWPPTPQFSTPIYALIRLNINYVYSMESFCSNKHIIIESWSLIFYYKNAKLNDLKLY